ncbi:MAG TPA: histidine kinase [Gemmatimonadaceae bacterium]|nr:histidine kinase [Gemmatimonadaceae bacterium]
MTSTLRHAHPISTLDATAPAAVAGRGASWRDSFAWQALRWTGVWSAICLVFVSQNALRYIMRGQPVDWYAALWGEALYWVPWVAFTPVLLGAARRWPLGSGATRSDIARHLAVMFAFSIVQVVASDGLQFWGATSAGVTPPPNVSALTMYERSFPALVITAWWKYWVFIGLHHAFDYHRRFREREVVAAQLETQLATAQLQALRMQLHPHFLFNALHSAAMLTMIDPEGAHRVLVQLSALLRSTLDRSSSAEVPLAEEIDFLDRYLAIERVRFQDRLQVDIEADDDALSAAVPNLILQPLVENAVRHGIARRSDARRLTIRGCVRESVLVLEVEDDGPGLPGGWTLESPSTDSTGVGLPNVRARLDRMYGERGRLELLAPVGADGRPRPGVLARVTVPFRPLVPAARWRDSDSLVMSASRAS